MLYRVVLYAEGSGETSGALTLPPAPGEPLEENALGPAHLLVRRCLEEAGVPGGAVGFLSPLRLSTSGRVPRGSDLLERRMLRRLLIWPGSSRRPDLAVVLVDRDGEPARKTMLEGFLEDVETPHVVGVAVEEFEAWLLADARCLAEILGSNTAQPGPPERMARREAMQALSGILGADTRGRTEKELRLAVAWQCRLDVLATMCPSFDALRNDIRARRG